MFNGTGMTICLSCGKRTHQEPGVCMFCSNPLIRTVVPEVVEPTPVIVSRNKRAQPVLGCASERSIWYIRRYGLPNAA